MFNFCYVVNAFQFCKNFFSLCPVRQLHVSYSFSFPKLCLKCLIMCIIALFLFIWPTTIFLWIYYNSMTRFLVQSFTRTTITIIIIIITISLMHQQSHGQLKTHQEKKKKQRIFIRTKLTINNLIIFLIILNEI